MSLVKTIDENLLPVIALSKFDDGWQSALDKSKIFAIWIWFKGLFAGAKSLAPLGNVLQILSFVATALLFLILPAPQFADDKEKLALLVLAAFGLRVLGTLLAGKERYKPSALDFLVLAFAGMNIVSTFSSHYVAASIKGLSKMMVYFISYFLFSGIIQQAPKKRGLILVLSLLAAGFVVSCHGLWQYKTGVAPLATWEDPNVEDKTVRIYSFLKNPNLLAGYLVPLIPVAFGTGIMALAEKGWKKLLSLPIFGVAGLILIACVLTGSRGGYMGIAAGLGALGVAIINCLWFAMPKIRLALAGLVAAIPVALVFILHKFPKYEQRILSIFAGREHSSNSYRLNVYSSSFNMFKDNWWLGVGPGNSTFKLAYGLYMRTGFDALGTYCVPLEVAVETGILGLFFFLWMIVSALTRAHLNFWNRSSGTERWLCAGAAAGLVGMMIHGLVDTVYYRPQVQFIFWLLLALCACIRPELKAAEQPDSRDSELSSEVIVDEAA